MEEKRDKSRSLEMFEEIPIVDFGLFLHGNDEEQREISKEIRLICEQIGFFYIKNFDFDSNLFERVYHQSKIYFDQSFEKKMELFIGSSTLQGLNRGYTPLFEEKLSTVNGDFKEAFDFAFELDENDSDRIERGATLYGPNRWPNDLPEFRRCLYQEFYLKVLQLGWKLLESFSLSLNFEKNYFRSMFERKPMITMRIIHYPPSTTIDDIGCGEHTDYECFTLLSQSNHQALEIQRNDGQWIKARPIPNTFVVNIGDLMSIWTNQRFKSTKHRVRNRTNEDRYSIPIFFGPNYFTLIRPLRPTDEEETNDESTKFIPFLAGKYLEERFDQTYRYRSNQNN